MRIIKVSAIDSTNSFARKFYEGDPDFEPVCVQAAHQTKGRGQRGSNWESKAGENLTFSILYPQKKLAVSKHFILSATISLAVLETLEKFSIPNLKVKWPNDILSARKKVGGILIENVLKTNRIVASIIGIGINVNQTDFEGLDQAGSLKTITGKTYSLDHLLDELVENIVYKLQKLYASEQTDVLEQYSQNMFRKDEVSVFELPNGKRINGIIRGVSLEGKLKLETEDSVFHTFNLKEIKMLY